MNTSRLFLTVVAFLAFATAAQAASVTATLDNQQISAGEPAQLTVTVTGSQEQPAIPSVDGLDITLVGQSTQIEVVNGSMTSNVCDTYQVTPQREGTFVIPAIKAGGAASQPITLRVGQGSAPATNPNSLAAPATNPNLPAPAGAPEPDDSAPAQTDRFGMMQVTLPEGNFYVGQLIPVVIKAYIPADIQATITDLPQMSSDAFTMNPLSTKPDRSTQIVNGRPYSVFTWNSALTAIKPGDNPLSLEMPETVVVMQRMPQMNSDPDDMFNNFFKNAFASMNGGVRKEIKLHNSPQTLKVQSLPVADRPAGFTGAVGQFDVESSATPTRINAGDPITLTLRVSGKGNFDRVSSDMLAADSHWKTYSTKSQFQPVDSDGFQGIKTFDQPVIPSDSGVTSIPSLSFSYFDPETGHYVTRTTSSIAIAVNGASGSPTGNSAASVATTPAASATSPTPQPPSPGTDLVPNKLESGSFVGSLQPVFVRPWFIAAQALPLLALLAALGFIRRQKQISHPERARATAVQQAIRQQVDAMDEAIKNRQTEAFFIHARSALQQRLGQRWNLLPETITLAEVEAHLGTESETIRPIFEMADQASYSDLQFADSDLRQWREVVLNELQPAEKN
jgi:hypothetical protein